MLLPDRSTIVAFGAWLVLFVMVDAKLRSMLKDIEDKGLYVTVAALSRGFLPVAFAILGGYLSMHRINWPLGITAVTLWAAVGIPVGFYQWDKKLEQPRPSEGSQPNKRLERGAAND